MARIFFLLWLIFLISACNSTGPQCQISDSTLLTAKISYHQSVLTNIEELSSPKYQGRKAGSEGGRKAGQFIVEQLKAVNISPLLSHYQQSFSLPASRLNQGRNIIGVIPGTITDQYIVITAHYDHLGFDSGGIYLGADDNASGVAVSLALAESLKKSPLNHSVIFLFTDAEELNLNGAKAFIQQQPELVNNIVLNINLDMLAGSESSRKLHFLTQHLAKILPEQQLHAFNELHQQPTNCASSGFSQPPKGNSLVKRRVNWRQASDHGVFAKLGIPVIYYGVGDHKRYHTYNDKFQRINQELLLHSANTVQSSLNFLDKVLKPL